MVLGVVSEERKRLVGDLRSRGITDERVLGAMSAVPREKFLNDTIAEERAYEDSALPIAEGQTISQPYTVAYQTAALNIQPGDKVLEIGTGSGYQTAILVKLGARVYTIERHIKLLEQTRKRLERMGYSRVVSRAGDGSIGWAEYAPFDAIIVTAGAPDVPETLTKQLHPEHGRMIIPVGDRTNQKMYLIKRTNGKLSADELENFRFVPLIGKEGWKE